MRISQQICFIILINTLLCVSCKPQEEHLSEDGSIKKEQLGDLVVENNISFNFEGNPIGFVKIGDGRQAYEWNPTSKSWNKVGNLFEIITNVLTPDVIEDNKDNYYMKNNNQIYYLNKTSNTWEILEEWRKLNPTPPGGKTTLLSNSNGDIFIKTYGNSNKNNYMFKKAGTSNWTEIKNFPEQLNILWTDPLFLTNKGYLYFQADLHLIPEMYNLNTNQVVLLFDKTEQKNFAVLRQFSFKGLNQFYYYVQADGTIFVKLNDNDTNEFVIYKFSAKAYPAEAEKVQTYPIDKLGHGNGWTTTLNIPHVTPSGELKTFINCSSYNESHLSEAYGRIGSNQKLQVYGHPITIYKGNHRMNFKGDLFIKYMESSYLYRW